MRMVFKIMLVFAVVALLAGFECILNCSCNLVAYPVPEPALLVDNTKIEEPKEFTLFVYMAADNDLESYAIRNLKEMERADFSRMNVLVLLDRSDNYDETNDNWSDTRLFELAHDDTGTGKIVSKRIDCPQLGLTQDSATELDMGNYNVLKSFLEFGKTNYKADKYALIIWGHGTGWRYSGIGSGSGARAVAIDDKSHSYMCVKELGLALQNQELCVIGFDTCFGSIFENLYEIKNCAEFIAASPGITPATGWNYTNLLEELNSDFSTAEVIASKFSQNANTQLSIIPAAQLPLIMTDLELFLQNLAAVITDENSRHTILDILLSTKSYTYSEFPCDMYIDLCSLAQAFEGNQNEALGQAAQQLQKATSAYSIGLFFIQKNGTGTLASSHPAAYLKNEINQSQCSFLKESNWWPPTASGNSGSVLDKLFYTSF